MSITDELTAYPSSTQGLREKIRAESANDYSNAAYASLLQIPITKEAQQFKETLGHLLFPERKNGSIPRPAILTPLRASIDASSNRGS
jgi:hypothetical protein